MSDLVAAVLWRAWLPALLLAVVAAQDPPSQDSPAPPLPAPEVPVAERELAEQLLRRHAQRSRDTAVLVADYVQRRTTELSARPLVSSGEFLFVAKPACVVFRAAKPRASVVRLSATCYEVYRPSQQRLERFHLGGPQLAQGLFAALAGDEQQLLRDFAIAGCQVVPPAAEAAVEAEAEAEVRVQPVERFAVRLSPRTELVRRHLRELTITLEREAARLCAITYRDAAGDEVAIELSALRANPEPTPSSELALPEGVRIVEHAPPPEASEPRDSKPPPRASERRDNGR